MAPKKQTKNKKEEEEMTATETTDEMEEVVITSENEESSSEKSSSKGSKKTTTKSSKDKDDKKKTTTKSSSTKKKDGLFKDLVFYIDVTSSSGAEGSEAISSKLEEDGASVLKRWSEKVTHMVFLKGKAANYKKASENDKIKIVNPAWVNDCVKQKKIVSIESKHKPEEPESGTKRKKSGDDAASDKSSKKTTTTTGKKNKKDTEDESKEDEEAEEEKKEKEEKEGEDEPAKKKTKTTTTKSSTTTKDDKSKTGKSTTTKKASDKKEKDDEEKEDEEESNDSKDEKSKTSKASSSKDDKSKKTTTTTKKSDADKKKEAADKKKEEEKKKKEAEKKKEADKKKKDSDKKKKDESEKKKKEKKESSSEKKEPKRSPTAYNLFVQEKRKENKDLSVADAGKLWKTLSDDEKKPYNEKAAKAKEEFLKLHPEAAKKSTPKKEAEVWDDEEEDEDEYFDNDEADSIDEEGNILKFDFTGFDVQSPVEQIKKPTKGKYIIEMSSVGDEDKFKMIHTMQSRVDGEPEISKNEETGTIKKKLPKRIMNDFSWATPHDKNFNFEDYNGQYFTHLIVPKEEKSRRTLKVLYAIAFGAYIVTVDWFYACEKEGKKVDEEPYSVEFSEISSKSRSLIQLEEDKKKRKSRKSSSSNDGEEEEVKSDSEEKEKKKGSLLLSGLIIHVSNNCKPPAKHLKRLIELLGGKCVNTLRSAQYCIVNEEEGAKSSGASCHMVNEKWLLDTISNYQLPADFTSYEVQPIEESPKIEETPKKKTPKKSGEKKETKKKDEEKKETKKKASDEKKEVKKKTTKKDAKKDQAEEEKMEDEKPEESKDEDNDVKMTEKDADATDDEKAADAEEEEPTF